MNSIKIKARVVAIEDTYGSGTNEFKTLTLQPACDCEETRKLFGYAPMADLRIGGLHAELVEGLEIKNSDGTEKSPREFKDCFVEITEAN